MSSDHTQKTTNRTLLVLGMHRSGTSVTTRLLHHCGAWCGPEEDLTGRNRENPTGFYEHKGIRKVCDALLHGVGKDWCKLHGFNLDAVPADLLAAQQAELRSVMGELSEHGLTVVKEPRICLLLPLLEPCFNDPVAVLTSRHPIEVAKSLRARNMFSLAQGVALWEVYLRSAISASAHLPRLVLQYEALLRDPQGQAEALVASLGELGVEGLSVAPDSFDFVDAALHRSQRSPKEEAWALNPDQARLWARMQSGEGLEQEGLEHLSEGAAWLLEDLELVQGMLSAKSESDVKRQIDRVDQLLVQRESLSRERETLRRDLAEIQEAGDQLYQEMAQIRATRSQKMASKTLYRLARQEWLFSEKRRSKFKRSAQKRDPKHRLRMLRSNAPAVQKFDQSAVPLQAATGAKWLNDKQKLQQAQKPAWAQAFTDAAAERTAVLVPVYNAPEDLEICIARLAAYTPLGVEILFIDDGSPDPKVAEILAQTAAHPNMRVLRNPENMGFTRTVNRGLQEAAPRDVIILNSDARVTPRWIEGIAAAVGSTPKVATVTPMSDRAGAFSAPMMGNDNELPPGVDEITYARAFRRRSIGTYPEVPTGNGFCMWISRAAMEEIGLLDAEAFPRGYGEENDFCMRAQRAGWRNLIDDRTYIFHDRSKSFGTAKNDLLAAGRAVIDTRYPEYKRAIAVYGSDRKILAARAKAQEARQDCARARAALPRVLYVISTTTGGTPHTNLDLMGSLEKTVAGFLLRCDSKRLQLWEHANKELVLIAEHELLDPVDPITHCSSEYEAVVSRWMDELDLDLVHIRHLGWHGLELIEVARRAGRAVVVSFHDFYALCPTVKLMDGDGHFCGGICSTDAAPCVAEFWPAGSLPPLKDGWVHAWRARFSTALAQADALITTSPSSRERVVTHLPALQEKIFDVIPHGRDFDGFRQARAKPEAGAPLRILVPGNISQAKGMELIIALLQHDTAGALEFHILGKSSKGARKSTFHHPRLIRHGAYQREEFAERAAAIQPHLGAVFSLWDETWCHTLTELWSIGLPVAVTDFATVATRVRESGAGWVLDHRDIPALHRALVELGHDAQEFARTEAALAAWRQGVGATQTTRQMAVHYIDTYRRALAHRRADQLPGQPAPALLASAARAPQIAVTGRADGALASACPGTERRLWERTHNGLERPLNYIRMSPETLLANLRTGEIAGALVQGDLIGDPRLGELAEAFAGSAVPMLLDLDADPAAQDAPGAADLTRLMRAADQITAPTEALCQTLLAQGLPATHLPDRLSLRLWRGADPARRAEDRIRVFYLGPAEGPAWDRIAPELAQAVEGDSRLRVALPGADPAVLPGWAEALNLPESGWSYHRLVPWLRGQMAHMDLLLLPPAPGAALTLLEAAMLGRPLLAAEAPQHRLWAEALPGLRLVPEAPGAWAAGLGAQIKARSRLAPVNRAALLAEHGLEPSLADFDAMLLRLLQDR